MTALRASVVICTLGGRPRELEAALAGLRLQSHREFEVIVVDGPGATSELPAQVRRERSPDANASMSRNLGIGAAAGEIVAFIDDDAVPEPTWLANLLAPYEDPGVAGSGGLVLDASGWRVQYRAALCDRLGGLQFDRRPPLVEESRPGADPFLYLQGTNMSFRRAALAAVGGLDEAIPYIFDEVELCVALIDAGHRLVALDDAPVHHHQAASAVRDERRALRDPLPMVRSHAYFAVRHRGERSVDAVVDVVSEKADGLRHAIRSAHAEGQVDAGRRDELLARIERGLADGSAAALAGPRSAGTIPPPPIDAYRPYLPATAGAPSRRICVLRDAPSARKLAGEGNDVHLIHAGGDSPTVALRDGLWCHRLGVAEGPLHAAAAGYHEVLRIDALGAVDAVVDEDHPAGVALREWAPGVAARLTGELLDPSAFPLDFVAAVQRVWEEPPTRFLDAVYELALGRESDAPARARWLSALEHENARLAVVQGILASDEARARDVPARWGERLAAALARAAPPRLKASWWASDEDFVRVAYEAILQRRADAAGVARWTEHLARGGSRLDVVDGLSAGEEARARAVPGDLPGAVRSEVFGALAGRLAAAREAGEEDFLRVLLLGALGREPDAGWVERLRAGGESRSQLALEIAGSAEARARGLPENALAAILAAAGEPG